MINKRNISGGINERPGARLLAVESGFNKKLIFFNNIAGKYRCVRRTQGLMALVFLRLLNGSGCRHGGVTPAASIANNSFYINLYLKIIDKQLKLSRAFTIVDKNQGAAIYEYLFNTYGSLPGLNPSLIKNLSSDLGRGWGKIGSSAFAGLLIPLIKHLHWNDPSYKGVFHEPGSTIKELSPYQGEAILDIRNYGRIQSGPSEKAGSSLLSYERDGFGNAFIFKDPPRSRRIKKNLFQLFSGPEHFMTKTGRVKADKQASSIMPASLHRGRNTAIIQDWQGALKRNEKNIQANRSGFNKRVESRLVMKGNFTSFKADRFGFISSAQSFPSSSMVERKGNSRNSSQIKPDGYEEITRPLAFPSFRRSNVGKKKYLSAGSVSGSNRSVKAVNEDHIHEGIYRIPRIANWDAWHISQGLIRKNHRLISLLSQMPFNAGHARGKSHSLSVDETNKTLFQPFLRPVSPIFMTGSPQNSPVVFQINKVARHEESPKNVNTYSSVMPGADRRSGRVPDRESFFARAERQPRLANDLSSLNAGTAGYKAAGRALKTIEVGENKGNLKSGRPSAIATSGDEKRDRQEVSLSKGRNSAVGKSFAFAGTLSPFMPLSGRTFMPNASLFYRPFNGPGIAPALHQNLLESTGGTDNRGTSHKIMMRPMSGASSVGSMRSREVVFNKGDKKLGPFNLVRNRSYLHSSGRYSADSLFGYDSSVPPLYGDEYPEKVELASRTSYRRQDIDLPPLDFAKKRTAALTGDAVENAGANQVEKNASHEVSRADESSSPLSGGESFNISRLADRVYREIEKRISIEKDRRGLI